MHLIEHNHNATRCGGHSHNTNAPDAQNLYSLLDEYHYHTMVFDAQASHLITEDEGLVVGRASSCACFYGPL